MFNIVILTFIGTNPFPLISKLAKASCKNTMFLLFLDDKDKVFFLYEGQCNVKCVIKLA